MAKTAPPEYPPSPTLGLGEVVVGQLRSPPAGPTPVPAIYRVKGRRAVLECRACDLFSKCQSPVPWSGPAPNLALVIGEAPGATEDQQGVPFVGVSGQLLRNTIRSLGLDPDALTYTNTVSCLPTFKPPTPRPEHLDACAPNLARTIRIVSPAHVLLVGAIALSRFRADLRITSAHGRPFVVPHPAAPASQGLGLWCFPLIHPASVLRDPSQRVDWTADLSTWLNLITHPTFQSRFFPTTCAVCKAEVHRYDPDGVAWCENHWAKGYAGWQASEKRRRWMLRVEGAAQTSIEMGTSAPITPHAVLRRTDPGGAA